MSTIQEHKPILAKGVEIKTKIVDMPKLAIRSNQISVRQLTIKKAIDELTQKHFIDKIDSGIKINESFVTQIRLELSKSSIPEEFKKMTTEEVETKFNISSQTLELKKGEIKEFAEGILIKKTKDGTLELYLVQE